MTRLSLCLLVLGCLAVAESRAGDSKRTATPAPATPPAAPGTAATPAPPAPVRTPKAVPRMFLLSPRAPREIDRKLSASSRGTVTIVNAAGSLVVTGWNQDQVRVTGTLGGGVKRMVFTRDGDQVTLQVVPRPSYPLGDASELEVHVPTGSRLDIKTFSAPIEVNGVTGTIEMESMNGSIEVSGSPRQVHAQCVECDMELNAAAEVVRAENMKGTINITNPRGLVDLSTVSGSIEMEAQKAGEVKLSAVSGSIHYSGNPGRNGSLVFQTHGGPIELTFPRNLSADFDILSYNGPVEIDPDLFRAEVAAQKKGRAREIHFSSGSGGTRIHIETFSGPVNVNTE